MIQRIYNYLEKFELIKDVPLFLIRIVLAYGFWGTGTKKYEHFTDIIGWFASLGIPFPTINAYLATATELAGVVLLTLGLFTRIISIPLIFVMLVAIFTVHITHGFEAGNNGFEIPLYYILLLLTLLTFGGGKFSLDYLIKRK